MENLNTDTQAVEVMDLDELQGIISMELTDAVSYIDTDLSPIRAKGTEYYRGDLFGTEEDLQVPDHVAHHEPAKHEARRGHDDFLADDGLVKRGWSLKTARNGD